VYTSFRETISIQVRTRSSVAISSEPQRDSETGLKIQLSFAVNKGNNKITENLIQPTISLEMPVPSQGHYGFHSFPVVD
jgi:uncharacterized protein YueI